MITWRFATAVVTIAVVAWIVVAALFHNQLLDAPTSMPTAAIYHGSGMLSFVALAWVSALIWHSTGNSAMKPGARTATRIAAFFTLLVLGVLISGALAVLTVDLLPSAYQKHGVFEPHSPAVQKAMGPIDAVITWVDGSDMKWQRRRRARAHVTDETDGEQLGADPRFPPRDAASVEVCGSIRTILRFAPWVRRIHVLTVRPQAPKCWDAPDLQRARKAGRLVLVHHDQCGIPETYSSHCIESRLHHIPGLAERFLYFNDDVFLGAPIHPHHFFDASGAPIARIDEMGSRRHTAWATFNIPLDPSTFVHMCKRHVQWMRKRRGRPTSVVPAMIHQQQPLTKQLFRDAERDAEMRRDVMNVCGRGMFRDYTVDIPVIRLLMTMGIYAGRVCVADPALDPIRQHYFSFTAHTPRDDLRRALKKWTVKGRMPHLFCIGEVAGQATEKERGRVLTDVIQPFIDRVLAP